MSKDSVEHQEQSVIYKPREKQKKAVSFVWILPVIIALILSWIAYESYMKKGTNIEIIFKSAEGLKEGVTPLEYKGLQLGKVTKIGIHDDLKSVKVNILVKNEAAKYVASESSRFWIRKPTISLTKISGLSTLISGNKIELSPKFRTTEEYEKGEAKFIFEGLDSKPDDELANDGYYVTLLASDKDNVEVGTPIFYNQFQVGEIASKEFKFEKVFLNAYIYDKFNYLVNKSSKFIMNNALKVNYGPSGLQIEVSSLYSALVGGITVKTPKKDEEKISKAEVYILYPDKDTLEKKEYFHIKFHSANGIGENTPIIYKGVNIGKITNMTLNPDDVSTKAFIYEKYKYLLTDKTVFFIQKPTVGFEGFKNLGNIIKGNYVSLTYKKGDFKNTFTAKDYKEIKEKVNSKTITLYSDNLNSITTKSKLYYKNIAIGKVLDYELTKDLKKVKIKVSIEKKYEALVNNHTLFYDMSSKLLQLKDLDVDVNYHGLENLLNGGIGIVTEKRKSRLTKNSFKLYGKYEDVARLKRIYNKGFLIDAYFDNDFKIQKDMSIIYKNQEIGFVKSIKFNENKSRAKLLIYRQYKKYLNTTSRFYKKSKLDVKASLNGILFEMDNFTSLLEGSIHLQSKSNMVYKSYQIFSNEDEMKDSSNSITILFDDVEGLHEQFSQLTYKGVKIGKVTKVSLTPAHKVKVKAQIYTDYEEFAKEGTTFYLKKPRISLQEVANAGSTLMAVNIGVVKSSNKRFKDRFIGHNTMPSLAKTQFGTIFKVESFHALKANLDSPIYYKNVKIGKVHKVGLANDGSRVIIDCLIYDKYTKLVRQNSRFYDISGFEAEFSIFGSSTVESNTFTSILKGGLVVVTPIEYNRRATSKDRFKLIKTLPDGWDSISPSIK